MALAEGDGFGVVSPSSDGDGEEELVDAEGVGVVSVPLAAPVSTSTHFWSSSASCCWSRGWSSAGERRGEPHPHEHRRRHRRQGYRLAGGHMEPGEQRLPRGRVARPGSHAGLVHIGPVGHLVSRHCASRSPRSPGSFLTDRSARPARSTCSCSVRPARSPASVPSVASADVGTTGAATAGAAAVPSPSGSPYFVDSGTPGAQAMASAPPTRASTKPTMNPPKLETGRCPGPAVAVQAKVRTSSGTRG